MIWTLVLPKSYLMNEETHGTYVKNAEAKLHVHMSWLPIESAHATYILNHIWHMCMTALPFSTCQYDFVTF